MKMVVKNKFTKLFYCDLHTIKRKELIHKCAHSWRNTHAFVWLHTWIRPGTRLSAVAKMSCLALVLSGDARRTLPAEEPSGAARINCCLGTVESSAVTIWIFCPVCCSVTICGRESVCVWISQCIIYDKACMCVCALCVNLYSLRGRDGGVSGDDLNALGRGAHHWAVWRRWLYLQHTHSTFNFIWE